MKTFTNIKKLEDFEDEQKGGNKEKLKRDSRIPPKIGFTPKNITNIYFDSNEIWDKNYYLRFFSNILTLGNKYAFLVKVNCDNGSALMAGKQFIVKVEEINGAVEIIYKEVINRLFQLINDYQDLNIKYYQIIYIIIDHLPELELKNINKLNINKEIVSISETKRNFNNNILPLTMNTDYFGLELEKIEIKESGKELKVILLDENNKKIDIFPILKNNSLALDIYLKNPNMINLSFYSYNSKISEFSKKKLKELEFKLNSDIIKIVEKEKFYIFVVIQLKDGVFNNYTDLEKNIRIIEVFCGWDLSSKQFTAFDLKLNEEGTEFKRKIKDTTITVKDNKIVKYESKTTLPTLKPINSIVKTSRNTNIGTFDVETYFNTNENKSFVYALGYSILGEGVTTFYKNKEQSSDDLIIQCINSLLKFKYHGFIFYAHNLSGYDVVYLLKTLSEYNLKNNQQYYILKPLFRDSKIIKLAVSIKINKKYIKIVFADSYLILPASLDKLGKDFNCEIKKSVFPYNFVNESTLNYIGELPSKDYFNTDKISDDEYKELYKNYKNKDWDLNKETIKYLEKDLTSLIEIIDKFNRYMFITYGIQITESLTIARIGINILHNKYFEKKNSIPLITKPNLFRFIKKGYYGGITEVYRPYVENANYYDINSEYPFVAKNDMPGTECTYIEGSINEPLILEDLFGFFYCKVKANKQYLGLLPLHFNGNLILPVGEFEGIWFSEELKFAKSQGYEIIVLRGYNFNKVKNVFNNYVDDLYKIRESSTGMVKSITKLLLNAPFGRLGMSIFKTKTDLISKKELDLLLSTQEISSFLEINPDLFLVNYKNEISKSIVESGGLDYMKILNKYSKIDQENKRYFADVSISTATAITAYARIYINKIKLWILNNGGEIIYSDTDSIVTNISLPSHLIGSDLGQLKIEHVIKKGYFLSSKTYAFETEKGEIIKKSKGVFSNSLTINDFEDMYYCNKDIEANRGDTKIFYDKGFVKISTKKVILKHNAYKKRKKIYKNSKWVDTEPINFEELLKNNLYDIEDEE